MSKKEAKRSFKNISFPKSAEYSSDSEHKPIEFIRELLLHSRYIYFKLGYFNSSSIVLMAPHFTDFLQRGGIFSIVCNEYLTAKDRDILIPTGKVLEEKALYQGLLSECTTHFYECLRYLQEQGRLNIMPVALPDGGLVHYKEGIAEDEEGNKLAFSGSMNFTYSGIFRNGESISIDFSWGSEKDKNRIKEREESYKDLFSGKSSKYKYLDPKEIEARINSYDYKDLATLEKEEALIRRKGRDILKKQEGYEKYVTLLGEAHIKFCRTNRLPYFPFPEGPRDYQEQAYKNWVERDYQGIFAMATGTGKTVTALNCVLEEYYKTGVYQVIVAVPSKALVKQWVKEVRSFGFLNTYTAYSGNPGGKKEVSKLTNSLFLITEKQNFIIVTTYISLGNDEMVKLIHETSNGNNHSIFIADEAHNLGASNALKLLVHLDNLSKRIGLSATPNRAYDEEGTAKIYSFFNSERDFCYEFDMERAIREDRLSNYYYYPRIVYLEENEWTEYLEITDLLKSKNHYDFEKKKYKDTKATRMLLLKRKRVIHKANRKIPALKDVIIEINESSRVDLKYTFIYTPEGYTSEQDMFSHDERKRYLDESMEQVRAVSRESTIDSYIGEDNNKDETLSLFAAGKIDILVAMKCLDEGIDVPRAQVGIFMSSTGNPRQFIQRRGRLLRRHDDKEVAYIYDLIVMPDPSKVDESNFKVARAQFLSELRRVAEFADLAVNDSDSIKIVEQECKFYDLSLGAIIFESKQNKK